MVKRKKKGLQRATVLLIAFIQLLTVFSPLVAYADEDSGSGDTSSSIEKSTREGNIYAEGNTLIHGAYETSSKYDPYVHYVTTYQTLMSRVGEVAMTSTYSDLYKGEHGEAITDSGVKIADKYGKKETSSLELLKRLDGITEEDEERDSEDLSAIEAGNESPEDTGTDIDEAYNKTEQYVDAISEEITNKLYDALVTSLSFDANTLRDKGVRYYRRQIMGVGYDVEEHGYNTGDTGGLTEGDWANGDLTKREYPGSGYFRISDLKNARKAPTETTDADRIYKEKLFTEVKNAVSRGELGLNEIDETFSSSSALGSVISNAEALYDTEYIAKGIETGMTLLTYERKEVAGNYWNEHKEKVTSWSTEDVAYLIRVKGFTGATGRPVTESDGVDYISRRFMWTFDNLPVSKSDIGTALTEAYNSAVGDLSKEYEQYKKDNEVEVDEDIRTLAWTPVYPKIIEGTEYLTADAIENLEEIDSRFGISGNRFTFGGETRSLQTMDLFLDTTSYSPVLIGDKGVSTIGDNKESVGDTGKVSSLHVGSIDGSISSGNTNTGQYVWYSPDQKGKLFEDALIKPEDDVSGTSVKKGNYLLGLYTSKSDKYSGSFELDTVGSTSTVGVDNYGNVINGDNGEVLLPYWQNHMFEGVELNDTFFPHSPMLASYSGRGEGFFGESNPSMITITNMPTDKEISTFVGGDGDLYKQAIKVKTELESGYNLNGVGKHMTTGVSGLSKEETIRGLAVIIATTTEDAVESWNTSMIEDARKGGELYVSFSPLDFDRNLEQAMDEQRWTAASMIQRIGWIMDYGFSDVLRLTVVSNLTRTYNTTVAEAGMENIFYTDTITNDEDWQSMMVLLATVLGAVLMGYLLIVGFKAYRGEIAWSKVITKALVLSAVLIYPMFLYGNLVEYTINKPTSWIMGNQMKLSAVLDTYFAEQNLSRNTNPFYENMFGKYSDSDELQLGSYNITFYTTMDKQGFDINTTSTDEANLSMIQSRRLERYQKGVAEYPKNQLVSVSVPLTDLYKWVWDVRYRGLGIDGYESTYGKPTPTNPNVPDYDTVVGSGEVQPLFVWLANGGGEFFSVSGYEKSLETYEEYKIMPEEVPPLDDANQQDVTELEAISTYGAGYLATSEQREHMARHLITEDVIEETLGLEVLAGSELFYEIVKNSSRESVDTNLKSLFDLSKMKVRPEIENSDAYIPTDEDMRALVRDLSNTSRGREYWYGMREEGTPIAERWSNFTRATFKSGEPGSTSGDFVGLDGRVRSLNYNPELKAPGEDFLGLKHIVQKYTPNRGEINPYRRTRLEEDVFSINERLINNYLSTYSITKMSMEVDDGRNERNLNHAETMVMATEAFFQFNKSLDWNHFPQGFEVDTIKFDKYMALVYIPFKDYGQPTMTFFDEEKVIPMSTAEHIAMNDSVWSYFAFAIAVVALVAFGLLYLAVLYFGLLLYSMYNFVYYYIIKSDYQNKSALGSFMILITMSISKIVLMLVVWAASWIMNMRIALSPVNAPNYWTTSVHSLALAGTVAIIFMFIIRPTWKGVMNDKENMGGQFFADKAQDVGKALTSGSFGRGKGKGVDGGSQASKFNDRKGRTRDGLRNNAGRLGNMNEKGLSQARKQASAIGGGVLGYGIGRNVANRTKDSVTKVNDALQNREDRKKGIDRTGRKHIDTSKVKAKNLLERKQLGTLGKTMNGLTQTVSGLGAGAVQVAKVGAELDNFKTGVITTMAMGSAGAASVVAKNLMDKGIQARSEGSNVLFDSSGYDLSKDSVRSELFNNSVADLQDQNVTKHANVMEGLVDGSTATNYDYSKGDSRIGVALDKKTGIHPETFNQLSQTQEFKDMFITPRADELMYDRKGNVIGLPSGGLRLVNPQMSATEVQNNMNKLYDVDNKLRNENNLEQRDQSDKRGVNIEGMEESYYNENIANLIKDEKGMYTQGSRIVFDTNNRNHNRIMKQINQKVDEYNSGIESKYGEESNNLMRYVVNDGDNQAILTETVNADENKVVATALYGGKNYNQNVRKFKVDENEIGQVGDNIEAVNKLRSVTNKGDKNLTQAVNDFTSAKKDMRKLLNNEVHDMTPQDRVVFNHEMMNYLDTTQVGNTSEFKTVRGNLQSIEKQFKQNEISSDQYHELVRRENENLTKIMDSTGKMDGFILNRYDSKNPYIKQYEEKSRAKSKADKKEHKSLKDMYNASVDKLDKEVGRKNLMEMPVGVVEASTSKHGEEYHLDGKGVLVQRADARKKRNALDGQDKDSVMSYLMNRPLEIKDLRERKLASD